MLRIFHVPQTRSMRIIWLCEELGHPYEIVPIDFSPEYRRSPEWRRLSPTGKVPAMSEGELSMFESGAMVQYILARHGAGRLEPAAGSHEHAHYLQWCWFAEATLARPLGDMVHHLWLKPEEERLAAVVEDSRSKVETCLEAVDSALVGRDFLLGGDFTAADIMMGYSLNLAHRLEALDARHQNVAVYFERLRSRPAFAIAVGAGS